MGNSGTKTPTTGTQPKPQRSVNPQTATQKTRAAVRNSVAVMEAGFTAGAGVTAKATHTTGLESIAAARVKASMTVAERLTPQPTEAESRAAAQQTQRDISNR